MLGVIFDCITWYSCWLETTSDGCLFVVVQNMLAMYCVLVKGHLSAVLCFTAFHEEICGNKWHSVAQELATVFVVMNQTPNLIYVYFVVSPVCHIELRKPQPATLVFSMDNQKVLKQLSFVWAFVTVCSYLLCVLFPHHSDKLLPGLALSLFHSHTHWLIPQLSRIWKVQTSGWYRKSHLGCQFMGRQ